VTCHVLNYIHYYIAYNIMLSVRWWLLRPNKANSHGYDAATRLWRR